MVAEQVLNHGPATPMREEETPEVTLKDVMAELATIKRMMTSGPMTEPRRSPSVTSLSTLASRASHKTEMESERQASGSREDAIAGKWCEGRVTKWITEKAFGFIRVGEIEAFIHITTLSGDVANICKERLIVILEADPSRGKEKYRVTQARRWAEHQAIVAREMASQAAQESIEAAARTKAAVDAAEDAAIRESWCRASLSNGPPRLEPQNRED